MFCHWFLNFSDAWCPIDGLSKERRVHSPVSRMFWMAHRLPSIKYTTLLVPQSAVAFTRNRAPVVVLLNMVPVFICTHALQRGCLHGLFPLYVSLCCMNVIMTKRSLRLGERRYATRGHFGSASLKRGGGKGGIYQWRIDGLTTSGGWSSNKRFQRVRLQHNNTFVF